MKNRRKVIYTHFYFIHKEAVEECLRHQEQWSHLGAQAGEPDRQGVEGGGENLTIHIRTYLKFSIT